MFGDLTKAFGNVTVSRKRSLQIFGGAIAASVPSRVPRSAEAKKKQLAFVAATVRSFELSDDATQFDVAVPLEFVHPDSGFKGAAALQTGIALAPSTDSTRRHHQVGE